MPALTRSKHNPTSTSSDQRSYKFDIIYSTYIDENLVYDMFDIEKQFDYQNLRNAVKKNL